MDVKKNEIGKSFYFILIIITLIVISIVIYSFFKFNDQEKEKINNSNSSGKVEVTYSGEINGLNLVNSQPLNDSDGRILSDKGSYFDFTVNTNIKGKKVVEYEIALEKNNTSTLLDKDIKIYLEKQNSGSYEQFFKPSSFKPLSIKSKLGTPAGSMVIGKVKNDKSKKENYRLRIWISNESVDYADKTYGVSVNVYGRER